MAMLSITFDENLSFLKPAIMPIVLPTIQESVKAVSISPNVYGKFLKIMSLAGVGKFMSDGPKSILKTPLTRKNVY